MKNLLIFLSMLFLSTTSYAKKNIHVIATGGTISGAGESSTGSKYAAGKVDIAKIIKSVENITQLANISADQVFQKRSQDLDDDLLLKLAKKVDEAVSKYSVDGVVITHGTDTMEETAYFLNLVINTKKPIILVGSMRPSTSLSADGPLNLYNAVSLAANSLARRSGVMVLMNDNIYSARDVRKAHTTNVSSFVDDNFGPLGQVYFGKVDLYRKNLKTHTYASSFALEKIKKLPKVDIIYGHTGFDENVIDFYVNSGTKAIILAGVGDGNINQKTTEKLIAASKKGIYIIRSNRGFGGRIIKNVEIEDDEYGFVTANNLAPQKARILAKVALSGKMPNYKVLQRIFDKY